MWVSSLRQLDLNTAVGLGVTSSKKENPAGSAVTPISLLSVGLEPEYNQRR